jgi:hypothetical protein
MKSYFEHAKIISRAECQETFPNIAVMSAERRAKIAAA